MTFQMEGRNSRGTVTVLTGTEEHQQELVDDHPLAHEVVAAMDACGLDLHDEHMLLNDGRNDAAGYDASPKHMADGGDAQEQSHAAKKAGFQRMKSKKRGDKKPHLKSWLCIMSSGQTSVLHADKYKLTGQLGIQMRDLRLLDPQMTNTYPSAILCRDKAIVVNLEHIKVIITMDRVLIVNYEDEANAKFVEDLKQRIAHPAMAVSKSFPSQGDLQRLAGNPPYKGLPSSALPAVALSAQLPFELRVLEVCLDELASEYDAQTTELEAAAYPALDTLAAKVTSPHLERVRRLKNRLVRLTTRVETVREVLEKFLDDDEDMHDLNLTANHAGDDDRLKIADHEISHLPHDQSPRMQGQLGQEVAASEWGAPEAAGMKKRGGGGQSSNSGVEGTTLAKRLSARSVPSSVSTDSSILESEVAEVEMLLEAYFMHFDNTYNRLTTLSEYIKDTEDLVNIKLDQHRNQLITTDLILTAFTASMAIITTVAGVFGMNLWSGLEYSDGVFNQVTIITCVGSFIAFIIFVVWAWRYGLLVFN